MNSLRKRLKSKKGSSVLEFMFGLLVFVMLAGFVVDVVMIANKQFTVSQAANQLVRQVSVQGGVRQSSPIGFQGGSRAYMSASDMNRFLVREFEGSGIQQSDWNMSLKGFSPDGQVTYADTLNSRTHFEVDYRNLFEFEIEYQYNWTIMGQMVPMLRRPTTVVQKRSAVSEFKYRSF